MEKQERIRSISILADRLLAECPGHFLVRVDVKPVDNIKVYIDADQGVSIETCVSLNRKLYRLLVEEGMFEEGAFSLELSSPGVDEPLKLHRQYVKNIGRMVEVARTEGPVLKGKLADVAEDGITLETTSGKGKKKEAATHVILFSEILKTTVQVVF